MHQQPLLAPPLPNKSSRAGQRSGVSGRMVSGIAFSSPLARWFNLRRATQRWASGAAENKNEARADALGSRLHVMVLPELNAHGGVPDCVLLCTREADHT